MHLRNARIAQAVADSLRRSDGTACCLIAFTIMPNHLHVLFETGAVPMTKLMQSWKGSSARAANLLLSRNGSFWQPDYWDTYMRDPDHKEKTLRYIKNNPVKAGLVSDWTQWPWTYVRQECEP